MGYAWNPFETLIKFNSIPSKAIFQLEFTTYITYNYRRIKREIYEGVIDIFSTNTILIRSFDSDIRLILIVGKN